MNKERIHIWEREFELEVKYDCYAGEEVLESQREALNAFLKSEGMIRDSLDQVKEYCIVNNRENIETGGIDNIFKYVIPEYLFISRNENKHIVAIMCNYRYDQEHGIAVVYENEKLKRIGKQDIIL